MSKTSCNIALQGYSAHTSSVQAPKRTLFGVLLSFYPEECEVNYINDSEVVLKAGRILRLSGLKHGVGNGVDR